MYTCKENMPFGTPPVYELRACGISLKELQKDSSSFEVCGDICC